MPRHFQNRPLVRPLVPLALAAAFAMTALQGAAFAAAPERPALDPGRSVTVDARGLDLASPAGVAAFDRRIETAALRACRPDDVRSLRADAVAAQCRREAVAAARAPRDAMVARAERGLLTASRIEIAPGVN